MYHQNQLTPEATPPDPLPASKQSPKMQYRTSSRAIFFMALGLGFILSLPLAFSQDKPIQSQSFALCDLQRDFLDFSKNKEEKRDDQSVNCEDEKSADDTLRLEVKEEESEIVVFDRELQTLVSGFPIEAMIPTITGFDREIAALIIGIGKKESNWGKRTPKLSGEECSNYWGYRGVGDRGFTPDGYGCFATPQNAVLAIGRRLEELRDVRGGTPEKMVIWKCGSSCATHSPESVRKWISDVSLYYREIAQK